MINPSCLIIVVQILAQVLAYRQILKTCSAHNIYASTVITAITAQNTFGVNEVMNVNSL